MVFSQNSKNRINFNLSRNLRDYFKSYLNQRNDISNNLGEKNFGSDKKSKKNVIQ